MSMFSQLFPPNPTLTEETVPDQAGKVFIITGAASGVGLELAKILYGANATVYIAARSLPKIQPAIQAIGDGIHKGSLSPDRLQPFVVDISNLSTTRSGVDTFLAKESRLDVLVHNAGIMNPPEGSKSAQGHELQMATHSLGPFLLTSLLEGHLSRTPGSRVLWVSSMVSLGAPKGGVQWEDDSPKLFKTPMDNYMQSKVGALFLAHEYSRRKAHTMITSISVHPGFMKTDLQRHMPPAMGTVMNVLFKGPKFGAYTGLWAALSPEVTKEKNGSFVIPWGRFGTVPCDIELAMTRPRQGQDVTLSTLFWDWCARETAAYC